jgi:alkaline phosphatase D
MNVNRENQNPMKQTTALFVLLLSFSTLLSCNSGKEKVIEEEVRQDTSFTTIAFGSCNKHDLPQPLWKPILEEKPDLWIWLGDNVYGDTHDMALLASKYQAQYKQEDYVDVRENMDVIGIWDDHDYGINDGGVHYAMKAESQQLLLDFLDVPEEDERRKRKGAYAAYNFGEGDQKVKIYLLDARYHRDTLLKDAGNYIPNLEGTILGEEQWAWLEEEFKQSDARINIIASGIQFIAEDHPFEKWANFPNERERLMQLIADSGIASPLLLSGDRHIGEMAKANLPNGEEIVEVTSSGLTHTWKEWRPEENRYRIVGDHVDELHYGLISIDWTKNTMDLAIKGEDNTPFLDLQVPF